jgi:hypothetical protein
MGSRKNQVLPKRIPSLLGALNRRVTISSAQAVAMALKPYIELDRLLAGSGGDEQFDALIHYTIFVEVLCGQGLVAEALPHVHEAQGALLRCAAEQRRTGLWALDENAREWMGKCLELFWRQLQVVAPPQLVAARSELTRILETHARSFAPQDLAA